MPDESLLLEAGPLRSRFPLNNLSTTICTKLKHQARGEERPVGGVPTAFLWEKCRAARACAGQTGLVSPCNGCRKMVGVVPAWPSCMARRARMLEVRPCMRAECTGIESVQEAAGPLLDEACMVRDRGRPAELHACAACHKVECSAVGSASSMHGTGLEPALDKLVTFWCSRVWSGGVSPAGVHVRASEGLTAWHRGQQLFAVMLAPMQPPKSARGSLPMRGCLTVPSAESTAWRSGELLCSG